MFSTCSPLQRLIVLGDKSHFNSIEKLRGVIHPDPTFFDKTSALRCVSRINMVNKQYVRQYFSNAVGMRYFRAVRMEKSLIEMTMTIRTGSQEYEEMNYVEIFSDDKGISHFRDRRIDFEIKEVAPPALPTGVSAFEGATEVGFLSIPSGWVGGWHQPPTRYLQYRTWCHIVKLLPALTCLS